MSALRTAKGLTVALERDLSDDDLDPLMRGGAIVAMEFR